MGSDSLHPPLPLLAPVPINLVLRFNITELAHLFLHQLRDEAAFVQDFYGSSAGCDEFLHRIHAKQTENGEGQVGRANRAIDRHFAKGAGRTNDAAAFDTTASKANKTGARPMVASAESI